MLSLSATGKECNAFSDSALQNNGAEQELIDAFKVFDSKGDGKLKATEVSAMVYLAGCLLPVMMRGEWCMTE